MKMEGIKTIQILKKEVPVTKNLEKSQNIEEVYEKYHQDLIRMCMALLRKMNFNQYSSVHDTKGDAEDLVNSAYEKLLNPKTKDVDLANYNEKEIKAYLFKRLRFMILNLIRDTKQKKEVPRDRLISVDNLIEKDTNFKKLFTDKILKIDIEKAMAILEKEKPKFAKILRLKYWEGRSDEEIGEIYNKNDSKNGVSRTYMQALRKKAEKMLGDILNKKDSV